MRWKIFLRPVRPQALNHRVDPSDDHRIHRTRLAWPARRAHPALPDRRKQQLTFSSQVAVWAVERIFDIGAFTVSVVLATFFLRQRPKPTSNTTPELSQGGVMLIGLVFGLAVRRVGWSHRKSGEAIADWVEKRFSHLAANWGIASPSESANFAPGLNTIHGPFSLLLAGRALAADVVHHRARLQGSHPFLRGANRSRSSSRKFCC